MSVNIERDLVDPSRMQVQQLRITDSGKYLNSWTTRFSAHVLNLITQYRGRFAFQPSPNVEARKDE
jgi:hypothetical protein